MRLEVQLSATDGGLITLPLQYNKAVQGLIYHQISEYLPELHDRGYVVAGRTFRLFVFSRLYGRLVGIKDKKITFGSPITILIGSPIIPFLELLGNRLLHSGSVDINWCHLDVSSVGIRNNPDFSSGTIKVKAISPITVYSTLITPTGGKKTYYYHPREKEFTELIVNNLAKKGTLMGVEAEAPFSIEPLRVKSSDLKTVCYNNFVIKGWLGQYLLKGDPRMIGLAYDAGLGAKNSQGFGMIDVIDNTNKSVVDPR